MSDSLLYDWNQVGPATAELSRPERVELNDETLRDGLQSPSVRQPSIDEKEQFLRLMPRLGIGAADLGYPGASDSAYADVVRLARLIQQERLPLAANCAGRTHIADLTPIMRASQEAGVAIEAALFLGSSAIRQSIEGWNLAKLLHTIEQAIGTAHREGLAVMFVTEDTTRARPDDLKAMYLAAAEAGATRFCVADTVGHATPVGAQRVVRFVADVLREGGFRPVLDWHGHRDRGLDVINSLAALAAGASRVHGCALGMGERVGNTPMDTMLVNLVLLGWIDQDLTALPEYCRLASSVTGVQIPRNYPVTGEDAFSTSTGVHAAAVSKAYAKGETGLADIVYSSVPASLVGRRQEILIGPMSGRSNVEYWLRQHGVDPTPKRVEAVMNAAKTTRQVLSPEQIVRVLASLETPLGA
ncbi:MAG: hypothetical protein M0Z53_02060 [Thermaerobacter sp.]|nr:hypothetical protein [Thermaerobacter sp.]